MENRAVFQKRGGREWVELTLVAKGGEPKVAKVSLEDLEVVAPHRWGWHPRGVYDWRGGVWMAYTLMPSAKRVGYRNGNRLDCRRENLISAREASEVSELCRKRIVRTNKATKTGVEGVHYYAEHGGYVARIKVRGVPVTAYFSAKEHGGADRAFHAAVEQRTKFLTMTYEELMAFKIGIHEVSEEEARLGDNVCGAIAERCGDPVEAARKGYEAGLMASRIITGNAEVDIIGRGARRNGRGML